MLRVDDEEIEDKTCKTKVLEKGLKRITSLSFSLYHSGDRYLRDIYVRTYVRRYISGVEVMSERTIDASEEIFK